MDDRQKVEQNNQEANQSFNKFRYEMSADLGGSLLTGYRDGVSFGPISRFGGNSSFSNSSEYLVKRMIEAQEKQMGHQGN